MNEHLKKTTTGNLSSDVTTIPGGAVGQGEVRLIVKGSSITVTVEQSVNNDDSSWQTIVANITTAGLHTFRPIPLRAIRYTVTYTNGNILAMQVNEF